LSPLRIANLLNEGGCPSPGIAWRQETIRFMLRNERYVGTQIYNRKSCKLRSLPHRNERSLWITKENAFKGIVPRELFDAAQAVSRQRQVTPVYSEQDLLDRLRWLLKKHGYLSKLLVDSDRGGPQECAYRRRFGTLRNAFAQVGYSPPRRLRLTLVTMRPRRIAAKTLARLRNALQAKDIPVTANPWTGIANIDGLSIAVAAARCVLTPVHGLQSWQLRYRRRSHSDFVLLLRMDPENKKPLDFWLLDRSIVRQISVMVLREPQFASWRNHRFGTLDAVVRTVRTRVRRHRLR
jgi:hypothetical protein